MENVIKVLTDFIETHYPEPCFDWPDFIFEYRVRQRWAAYEVVSAVVNNPEQPPDQTVEEFLFKMQRFYQETELRTKEELFSIAIDVAEELLMLLV